MGVGIFKTLGQRIIVRSPVGDPRNDEPPGLFRGSLNNQIISATTKDDGGKPGRSLKRNDGIGK